jgi:hypothetical protein
MLAYFDRLAQTINGGAISCHIGSAAKVAKHNGAKGLAEISGRDGSADLSSIEMRHRFGLSSF